MLHRFPHKQSYIPPQGGGYPERRRHNVPFIVLTAQGSEEIAVEMMKRGAMDYIVKDTGVINVLPHVIKRAFKELDYKNRLAKADDGTLISYDGIVCDITDRKQAEKLQSPCTGQRFFEAS